MSDEDFTESRIEYVDSGPAGARKVNVWLSEHDYAALVDHASVEVVTTEPDDEIVSVAVYRLPPSDSERSATSS